MKRSISIIFVMLFVCACGSAEGPGGSGEPLTTVGNPNPTIPAPLPESLKGTVKALLAGNPYWEGSIMGEGNKFEDVYVVKFDADADRVKVKIVGSSKEFDANLEIYDVGNFAAKTDDSTFKISGKYDPKATRPLELFAESEGTSSQIFAMKDVEESFFSGLSDPTTLCKSSEEKRFEATLGVWGNERSHIAGAMQLKDPKGNECGAVIHDYCTEEGKAEIIPYENDPEGLGYAVKMVRCNECLNGKCVGKMPDDDYDWALNFYNVCIVGGSCVETDMPKEAMQVPINPIALNPAVNDFLKNKNPKIGDIDNVIPDLN